MSNRIWVRKYVATDEQRFEKREDDGFRRNGYLSDGNWVENEIHATLYETAEMAKSEAKKYNARLPHAIVVSFEF